MRGRVDYRKYSHHHTIPLEQEHNQDQDSQNASIHSHNVSKSTNYCHNGSQSLIIATNEKHIKIVKCIRNFPSDNTGIIEVKTHIENKIRPGDILLGYDLKYINLCETYTELIQGKENFIPDVILVKKKAVSNANDKKIKLEHLKMEKEIEVKRGKKKQNVNDQDDDYEEFINDIKEDKEMIANIGLEDNTNEDDKEGNKNNMQNQTELSKQNRIEDDDDNSGQDELIFSKKAPETNAKDNKGRRNKNKRNKIKNKKR